MFVLALTAMTFAGCEDVPMPYGLDSDEGGGDDPTPTTTAIEVNCAGAVEQTNALDDGATSSDTYAVTGYITEVVGSVSNNQQTFWMADTKDGGKVFEAFYANLPEGVSEFKKGAKVKITGKLTKYVKDSKMTPEIKNPTVEILEDGDDSGGTSGTAAGDGTLQTPYNPTAANNLASSLGWKTTTEYETSDNVYVKGKISSIKETYTANATNGNATFYISEDGKEESDQFQCYRVLYLGNKKYTSGTDIKKGDEVIIYGKLMNFRGNTPETVQNQAYLYSLNGNTEGGGESGGGDTPGGDTGTAMTKSVDGLVVTFTNPNATAGESVTYDLTTCGLDHQAENPSFTLNNVSFAFAQGDGSTTPKYWKTGNYDEFRMYAKNVLTIVGTANIASIVFQCVNNNGNPAVGNEQAYATVNGKTLTFVNDWTSTSSGTQFRFKSVTITYAK